MTRRVEVELVVGGLAPGGLEAVVGAVHVQDAVAGRRAVFHGGSGQPIGIGLAAHQLPEASRRPTDAGVRRRANLALSLRNACHCSCLSPASASTRRPRSRSSSRARSGRRWS